MKIIFMRYLLLILIVCSNICFGQTYIAANGDTVKVTTVKKTFAYDSTFVTVSPYVKPPVIVVPPPVVVVPPPVLTPGSVVRLLSTASKFDASCAGTGNSIGSISVAGRDAISFTVVKGSTTCAGGLRSEVSLFDDLKATYPYEVRYSVSYYIPLNWVDDQPTLFDIANQWHDYPTLSEAELKSPFDFGIDGTRWNYRVRSGGSSVETETTVDVAPVEKGKWVDFVFHLIFSKSGNGLVEIWKDGAQITAATWKKPMGFNHVQVPFFKVGIYKWPWNPQDLACCGATNSKTHTIYVSNVKLGNNKTTNNDLK